MLHQPLAFVRLIDGGVLGAIVPTYYADPRAVSARRDMWSASRPSFETVPHPIKAGWKARVGAGRRGPALRKRQAPGVRSWGASSPRQLSGDQLLR